MENKFKKSQVLVLSLLAILLIIAPLLSSSLRPTYLYFITNLLVIALGAEAGLLSLIFSKPLEDNKIKNTYAGTLAPEEASPQKTVNFANINKTDEKLDGPSDQSADIGITTYEKKAKIVEKTCSQKIVGSVKAEKVKKCPSMPSLFFIGGGDQKEENFDDDDEKREEEVGEEITGQELFTKAETFIGNFYKQLKMQREDSWKKIHGFYQRAF